MRLEAKRVQEEMDDVAAMMQESEGRCRALEEELKELKDTVKAKNRAVKRLEMLLGQSTADLESVTSNETADTPTKKSKKKGSKSPKHKKHHKQSSPKHAVVEATNFSFSPTDVGANQTLEESTEPNPSVSAPADVSPALLESRKSMLHLQEEEKKMEEREEVIHSIEHEIEELEAQVAREVLNGGGGSNNNGDKSKAELDRNARELLEQKKVRSGEERDVAAANAVFVSNVINASSFVCRR